MAFDPTAGATRGKFDSPGGGHIVGSDPPRKATPQDLIPRGGGPHRRIYHIYMFILTIPREGPHRRIGSQGGGPHRGIRSPGEGHIAGSDPPGGGYTGGSASKSNISASSNLYSKGLQGMNQGVVGRVLIHKTACKKSRVSVPLRGEI